MNKYICMHAYIDICNTYSAQKLLRTRYLGNQGSNANIAELVTSDCGNQPPWWWNMYAERLHIHRWSNRINITWNNDNSVLVRVIFPVYFKWHFDLPVMARYMSLWDNNSLGSNIYGHLSNHTGYIKSICFALPSVSCSSMSKLWMRSIFWHMIFQ